MVIGLKHMSSVLGERETTKVLQSREGQRRLLLLSTANYWEGTEKSETEEVLIQHLTEQALEKPTLALTRMLNSWRTPPNISSNPNYTTNLKSLLNMDRNRTIS